MKRYDFYYKRLVTESDLDQAFDESENADRNIVADLGLNGVTTGGSVVPFSPTPNMSVVVAGPAAAYDPQGRRIAFASNQIVSVSVDENGASTSVSLGSGNYRYASIFVKFDRLLSDPKLDGNNSTVFFQSDESFEFDVVVAAEGTLDPTVGALATRPVLRPGSVLLADILIYDGMVQVLAGDILVNRRQDLISYSGNVVDFRGSTINTALTDMGAALDNHVDPGTGVATHADDQIITTVSAGFPVSLEGTRVSDKLNEIQQKFNAALVYDKFTQWDGILLTADNRLHIGSAFHSIGCVSDPTHGVLFNDPDGRIVSMGSSSFVSADVINGQMANDIVEAGASSGIYSIFSTNGAGAATISEYTLPLTSDSLRVTSSIPTTAVKQVGKKLVGSLEWLPSLGAWVACVHGEVAAVPTFEIWVNTESQPSTGVWVKRYTHGTNAESTGIAESPSRQLITCSDGSFIRSSDGITWERMSVGTLTELQGCVFSSSNNRFYSAGKSSAGQLVYVIFEATGDGLLLPRVNIGSTGRPGGVAVDDVLGGGVLFSYHVNKSDYAFNQGQIRSYYFRNGSAVDGVNTSEITVIRDFCDNFTADGHTTVVPGNQATFFDKINKRFVVLCYTGFSNFASPLTESGLTEMFITRSLRAL